MAGLMDAILGSKVGQFLTDDTNQVRLAGLGQALMSMDQGQTPDMSYLGAVGQMDQERSQQQAFQQQIQDPELAKHFTPAELSFLAKQPREVALPLITERVFAKPEAPKFGWQTMPDGTLVRTNSDGTTTTMGSYAKPEAPKDDRTSSQKDYGFYADQERAAGRVPLSFNEWDLQAKKAGATNVNVDAGGKGQDKFDEAFGTADAKTIDAVSNAGLTAQRNLGRIDQLDQMLQSSPSGWQAAAQQAAGEWGINTDGLDMIQAAQAMINSLVPEQRAPGTGPMSDADLNLFKQSLPRLINSPGGNRAIIDTMRAMAQYDAQGAQIVQQLRSGQITRSQAFDALQNRANPIDAVRKQLSESRPARPNGMPASSVQGPTTINGYKIEAIE